MAKSPLKAHGRVGLQNHPERLGKRTHAAPRIMPLLSTCTKLANEGSMSTNVHRVTSGDDGLDYALGGGFSRGGIILLKGGTGTGRTMLGCRFICKSRDLDEPAMIILTNQSKESFLSSIQNMGGDCNKCLMQRKHDILEFPWTSAKDAPIVFTQYLLRAKELEARRLLVDSFTPIAQLLGSPVEIHHAFVNMRDLLGKELCCTIMLVADVLRGESPSGGGVEEFLADTILELGFTDVGGHRVRELTIQKFRAGRIQRQRFVCTLERGFRTIRPFTLRVPEKTCRFQPLEDPPNKYSTGVEELDLLLDGGYPRRGVVLVDLGEQVTIPQYRLVINPVTWNFFSHKRGRVSLVGLGADLQTFEEHMLSGGFSQDELRHYARILTFDNSFPQLPFIFKLDGDCDRDINQYRTITEELVRATGAPILQIVSVDSLIAVYGTDTAARFLDLYLRFSRKMASLCFVIVRPYASALRTMVGSISDMHLRMDVVHDTLVLYGVKPRIDLHFVQPDASRGYLIPQLTRH